MNSKKKHVKHIKEEDISNVFWKYYDLYRRKQHTLDEYSSLTGIDKEAIGAYLALV